MKDVHSTEDLKIEKLFNDLKLLQISQDEKSQLNDLRICNLEKSILSQGENLIEVVEKLKESFLNNNNNENTNTSENNNQLNNQEVENKSNDIDFSTDKNKGKSNIGNNLSNNSETKPSKSPQPKINGADHSAKELTILKTNFEMQLSTLKNEIKNINRDISNKHKELYTYVASQMNEIENRNTDNNFNKTKKSEVFKMPIFDNKDDNKFIFDQENYDNNPNINILNSKISEIEERLFEIEHRNRIINKNNKNEKTNLENDMNDSFMIDNSFNNGNNNFSNNPQTQKLVKDLSTNLQFNDFLLEKINTENKKFERYIDNIKINSDDIVRLNNDISKIYESILALRKLFGEIGNSESDFGTVGNKTVNELQEKIKNLSSSLDKRIIDIDKVLKKLKDNIEESTKGLIDKEENTSGNNLKEFFNLINKIIKHTTEKTDKNSVKLENFTGEVINKLKKDLTCNTLHIIKC